MNVDTTNDIAEFLTSRRAKITPEQAGLPTYGKRRVPGLRREEVAGTNLNPADGGWVNPALEPAARRRHGTS